MAINQQNGHADHDPHPQSGLAANSPFADPWLPPRDSVDGAIPSFPSQAVGLWFSRGREDGRARPEKAPLDRDIEIEDWDSLFGAVEDRLREIVESKPAAVNALPSIENRPGNLRAEVLDCVASLELLHASLKKQRR